MASEAAIDETTDAPADPAVAATRPPTIRTPDGTWLDPARYQHLLCDPVFHALLVDGHQIPLALGRAVRLITPAQRRALAVRDRGCVFPGCDRPPGWCDAHHIRPYEAGGATDLSNLALLCRHHHGVTHRRGWTMQANLGGSFIWTTPTGRQLVRRRADVWIVAA